jgi:hypothetical protein
MKTTAKKILLSNLIITLVVLSHSLIAQASPANQPRSIASIFSACNESASRKNLAHFNAYHDEFTGCIKRSPENTEYIKTCDKSAYQYAHAKNPNTQLYQPLSLEAERKNATYEQNDVFIPFMKNCLRITQ